ncbi:MAG: M56 family metallopeptidase [Sphingomicrobium sp.]
MIDWLTDTLVATTALMALVLLFREPVRRAFGPAVAYALWLIPAVRMVMPSLTRTVERIVPAPAHAGDPSMLALAYPGGAASASLPEQFGSWPSILVAAWLVGAAMVLVRGLAVYTAQRRAILGDGVQLARIGGIRLVRSERVSGPMAFGIIDRVIIVPLDFDHRFTECQRRLALDHELAHHRSGDLVANAIAFVLLCLQWFNPLAWAAHAAFRFDQEAACDARVLDKADDRDRLSYGQAIANAASGRAILFAGALDRPSTLSRRLTLMTRTTDPMARKYGFALLGGALLIGLPLTATRALQYVDVAQPEAAPVPASAPVAPMRPAVPAAIAPAAAAAAAVIAAKPDISFIADDTVRIHGKTKKWEELTPAERSEIRIETAKARREINQQLVNLPKELEGARKEAEKFKNGEYKREMANARVEIKQALAELDAQSAIIRASGQDPEKLKAEVRGALREIETMDIDKVVRESLAAIDPDAIRAQVMSAAKSLDDVDAKLDRLDRR